MTEVALSVRGLSKCFKLYPLPRDRVLEWLTLGRRIKHEKFWALRDVSFEVQRGESVAVIGLNGAGKTTLLKILSRALYPTTGEIEVRGRLVSLLELGTGFHPELTGRQNIYESARLLGFSDRYVADRLDAILAFAGIGEFVDQPVKHYSSGMFVRLAFSLFAHLEPDVYLVDEALSVGDIFFQQKCFERFRDLRARGCTILFVSHDMDAVMHLCERAILLSEGRVVAEGDARSVVHDYFALMGRASRVVADGGPVAPALDPVAHEMTDVPHHIMERLAVPLGSEVHADAGTRDVDIVGFAVATPDGRPTSTTPSGQALCFWYLLAARKPSEDLNVGIHFYDRRGILVFAAGNANCGLVLPRLAAGDRLVCKVTVTLAVQPGEYTVVPQVGGLTAGSPEPGLLHDRLTSLAPVVVSRAGGPVTPFYGLVNLDTEFAWTKPC